MIVTMLHWLIKELIKGHPSDAAELIKSFMSWLQNNALIKMFSCQDALRWIHYRNYYSNFSHSFLTSSDVIVFFSFFFVGPCAPLASHQK